MKKNLDLFVVVFLLTGVLFTGCDYGKDGEIMLLHVNDYHGATITNNNQKGIAVLASYTRAIKSVYPNVLFLNAGDINTGSAFSDMFDAEPDILGFNMAGLDAAVFGEHEFYGTMAKLERQIEIADFLFISSNIKTKDGSFLGGNQYIIKRYDRIKTGVFGITTLRTKTIASPDSSLVFINEIEAARDAVNILRKKEKVDIVIALTHMGDVKESEDHITSIELAQAVPGIDIIVDGHSHTLINEPVKIGDTWIVTAYEFGKFIGHATLTVERGKITGFSWRQIIPMSVDEEVLAMLEPYIEKADAVLIRDRSL